MQNPPDGKTIVVSGGAGFLGSHLCEALLTMGDHVICVDNYLTSDGGNIAAFLDHPRFQVIEQDICRPLHIGRGKIHQVYNLACPASPPHYQADPIHTLMTNVLGTKNLLELAREHNAVFLQASTSEVYGDPAAHPQSEDYWGNVNCTGPRACYDEGKRAAEALCFDFMRTTGLDVRVARIFNTYGPKMRPDDGRIVSNLIVQALKGEPLTIYGDGEQTRSFCYCSDLIDGLQRLMNVVANPDVPINLGNPGEFSVLQLAEMVLAATGSESELVRKPLPQDDPRKRRPDIARAKRFLDWEPTTDLATGLHRTIPWFAQILAADRAAQGPASVAGSPAIQDGLRA